MKYSFVSFFLLRNNIFIAKTESVRSFHLNIACNLAAEWPFSIWNHFRKLTCDTVRNCLTNIPHVDTLLPKQIRCPESLIKVLDGLKLDLKKRQGVGKYRRKIEIIK